MNTAFINSAMVRSTATVAILAILAGVVAPIATSAQVVVADPLPTCTVIVSSNENGDVPTQGGVGTFVHNNWVDENAGDLAGAYWLWSDALVTDTTVNQKRTFTQDFIWGGSTIANIDFKFASDNGYLVKLNGSEIGSGSTATDNHTNITNISVDEADIITGENTISFEITNLGTPEDVNPENNPAGFIFKMIIDGTGTNCDEIPPVDVCSNIPDAQATLPEGYAFDGDACYLIVPTTPDVVSVGEDTPLECIGKSLVDNGSFEDPVITSSWQVVGAVANWLSNVAEGFEVWRNFNGTGVDVAAHGAQNLELSVNTASTITQDVATVAGNVYQVSFAFSPRSSTPMANNSVEVFADTSSIGTVSADGSDNSANSWTTHTYQFTATDASTALDLKDIGTSDGVGSLVDNVQVCLVDDNTTPVEPDTYEIFGFVFDDTDEDDNFDEGEADLEGWTVRAVNASNSEQIITDTTDGNGRYSLNVPAGTWIISQETENGWELLSNGNNGDGTYTLTVPEGVTVDSLVGFLNSFLPTAMAAEFDEDAGPFNFGNDEVEQRSGSSRSSGTRVGSRTSAPAGSVLGASTSTPTGTVLGDATTTMPVGAPNTGSGGTAPVTVNLGGLVAVLTANSVVRKSK